MFDASSIDNPSRRGPRYAAGLATMLLGYGVALFGNLAFFKIPLSLSIGMMVGGLLLSMLVPKWFCRILAPRFSQVYSVTSIIGILVISVIMLVFSNANWKTWYFHPAGFQGGWFVLVTACFHFGGEYKHLRFRNHVTDIPATEFDDSQSRNPYAPPMLTKPKSNTEKSE